ncbi:D-arabinitol dehydrogenase 1 [Talaromyces pinophilus]|nr:D-arabinitol dehydrogenase 1 [Talaromyces pinophilus]
MKILEHSFPVVPGHETVGVVAAFGSSVKGFKVGVVNGITAVAAMNYEYVELPRAKEAAKATRENIQSKNPYGFDIVVVATGSAEVFEDSINFAREGGKLVAYGVYPDDARCRLSTKKIFKEEINIIGSFSQVYKFPAAIDYLVECPPRPLDGNRMIVTEQ